MPMPTYIVSYHSIYHNKYYSQYYRIWYLLTTIAFIPTNLNPFHCGNMGYVYNCIYNIQPRSISAI